MGIKARKTGGGNGGSQQDPIEIGNYPARLVQVIDMGLQPQRPYQGKEKPPIDMLKITYELTDEFMKDEKGAELEDKPRWQSEDFPLHALDSDRATSTKRYNVLDPEHVNDGDWGELLGASCMVTITQYTDKNGNVRNGVGGIAPMRDRDMKNQPELKNPPKIFTLDEPDMEIFGSFPEWLQDKIKANLEFKGSALDKALSGDTAPAAQQDEEEDDIPW